jgi:hypothetical protein
MRSCIAGCSFSWRQPDRFSQASNVGTVTTVQCVGGIRQSYRNGSRYGTSRQAVTNVGDLSPAPVVTCGISRLGFCQSIVREIFLLTADRAPWNASWGRQPKPIMVETNVAQRYIYVNIKEAVDQQRIVDLPCSTAQCGQPHDAGSRRRSRPTECRSGQTKTFPAR